MGTINEALEKQASDRQRRRMRKLRYEQGMRVRQLTLPVWAVPFFEAVKREMTAIIDNIDEAYVDNAAKKEAIKIRQIRVLIHQAECTLELGEDSPHVATFEGLIHELEATFADRHDSYGDFNMGADIAAKVIHAVSVCPDARARYAMGMIAVKLSRLCYDPYHMDSWRDIAGYALCGQTIQETPKDE